MTQPLVSVVTPFYNTDPYLAECIESVLAQRYDNFEYILLNNHSTDVSREIAQKYADRRFAHQAHRQRDAPAAGAELQPRSASYLASEPVLQSRPGRRLDSPGLPRQDGRVRRADPSVAVVGAYGQIEERVHFYGLPLGRAVFSGKDVCRRFWANGLYIFGSPTCVMYRSDLVRARKEFYDASCPLEDADVCFELLKERDFGFVHQVLTFTRRQNESIHTQAQPLRSSAAAQAHDAPSPWSSLSGALGLCPASGCGDGWISPQPRGQRRSRPRYRTRVLELSSSGHGLLRFQGVVEAGGDLCRRDRAGSTAQPEKHCRGALAAMASATQGFDVGIAPTQRCIRCGRSDCDRSFAIDWGPQHSVCVAQPRHNSGACG